MAFADEIVIPRDWPKRAVATYIRAHELARNLAVHVSGWCTASPYQLIRAKAGRARAEEEMVLLRRQLELLLARFKRLSSNLRPDYTPDERAQILALQSARGWSRKETARQMLIYPGTASRWWGHADGRRDGSLLTCPYPVNRYPEYLKAFIKDFREAYPWIGRNMIAALIMRVAVHISKSAVYRAYTATNKNDAPPDGSTDGVATHVDTNADGVLALSDNTVTKHETHEELADQPLRMHEAVTADAGERSKRRVSANYVHHVWHTDLTAVPVLSGFFSTLFPGRALPQSLPFAVYVLVVMDHFSRKVLGICAFANEPSSEEVRTSIGRVIYRVGRPPKYLVTDSGPQFKCAGFKAWTKRRGIEQRRGAVGQHGSIAVVERFIKTLKESHLRRLQFQPNRKHINKVLEAFSEYYNEFRPHEFLKCRTPNDVYHNRPLPEDRIEPRPEWPVTGKTPGPVKIREPTGVPITLFVEHFRGMKHLPIVRVKSAA